MAISIDTLVPAFRWLRTYQRSELKDDLVAGVTVAIMLVPQGMAYAMLAGLPPVIGLYASTVPLVVYALFGSSRHLAVGPVAMVSLLVFVSCSRLAEPGSDHYIAIAVLLSLMVGAIQFLLGSLRLGFLENFISHAVISGFTSAAAIVISLSQLKHILGIHVASGHSAFSLLSETVQRLGDTNPVSVGIGLSSIGLLLLLKRKYPLFPAPLLIVIGGTLLVYLWGLRDAGVQTVGKVPQGFPSLSLPEIRLSAVRHLVPTALTILFVGYIESIAVAELVAARKKYTIDPDQELKGLGLANIVGSFFSCYPVTGGFSRTAVNYQAGARTALASFVTAVIVLLTLLFLTPLFSFLPNAVLAAIIIVAVLGLIDVEDARYLFRVKRANGWALVLTFLTTLAIGVEQGILIGVAFSLLLFIWRSSRPHVAELGFLGEEGVFHDITRFPEEKTYPQVLILRIDASLYFANMKFLEDTIRRSIEDRPDLRWVVLDFSGVNDMDAVAVRTLEEMMDTYGERGITFTYAAMKGPVRDLVARAGWTEKYEKNLIHASVQHVLRGIGVLKENG